MEDIESALADARAIVDHIHGVGSVDVAYDDKATLQYVGQGDDPSPRISKTYTRYGKITVPYVSTVSSVSPLLAGMVLAGVRPRDNRIQHGLALAAFNTQLTDLFPQLEPSYSWIKYPRYKITFTVDPLQQDYFLRIEKLFPPFPGGYWHRLRDGYYFESYDVSSCDMGAYLWKISNTH